MKTLREWIETKGEEWVADRCGVTRQTVNNWKFGYLLPRPEHLLRIVYLSGLEMQAIVEEHFSKANKNRWKRENSL